MKIPEKPPDPTTGSEKHCRELAPADEIVWKEIEGWRDQLARNLALRNHDLKAVELNTVVHKIIDGMILLRLCENRGIERSGTLAGIITGDEIFPRLVTYFEYADKRYDAGLFSFHGSRERVNGLSRPALRFNISDSAIKEIIPGLYRLSDQKNSPLLSPFTLGRVYEQMLARMVRLHGSHLAVIECTPGVKRAGGICQIPHDIKGYAVKKTIAELVAGKNPEEVSKMRILDPACGSGSVLLIAFQNLLDWHLDWYIRNLVPDIDEKSIRSLKTTVLRPEPPDGVITEPSDTEIPSSYPIEKPGIYPRIDGESSWKLTLSEKKRILLNTVFGVDIDPRAVAATRFLLLLNLVCEEDERTVAHYLTLNPVGILPDLQNNIKCGNSLIGQDYFDFGQSHPFNFTEQQKINPFDWDAEFPEILNRGGFDAVIGNLPFALQEMSKEKKKYLQTHYCVYASDADPYPYFIEKGLRLIRPGGILSAIIPDQWLHTKKGRSLRKLLKNIEIEEILDFPLLPVCGNATMHPCCIRISNKPPSNGFIVLKVQTDTFHNLEDYVDEHHHVLDQRTLGVEGWTLEDQRSLDPMRNLQSAGGSVEEYVMGQIYRGITTRWDEAFIINEDTKNRYIKEDSKNRELVRPLLTHTDIQRYHPAKANAYLIFVPGGWTDARSGKAKDKFKWFKKTFPIIASHFEIYAKKREVRSHLGDYWWELPAGGYYEKFTHPKLIISTLCPQPACTYDRGKNFTDDSCFIIPGSDLYLLGILNSKLTRFICLSSPLPARSDLSSPAHSLLKKFPLYVPDFDNPRDNDRYNRMDTLVTGALDVAKRLSKARTEHQKTTLETRIKAIDAQIDALVYELYGLNDEEIRIIEECVK